MRLFVGLSVLVKMALKYFIHPSSNFTAEIWPLFSTLVAFEETNLLSADDWSMFFRNSSVATGTWRTGGGGTCTPYRRQAWSHDSCKSEEIFLFFGWGWG